MNQHYDSTDRQPTELVLFAVAFASFLVTTASVILAWPGFALTGLAVLILSVACFGLRSEP